MITLISVKFSHWLFTNDSTYLTSIIPIMVVALSGPYAVKMLTPDFEVTILSSSNNQGAKVAVKMLFFAQAIVLVAFVCVQLILFLIALPNASSLVGALGVLLVYLVSCFVGLFFSNVVLLPLVWLIGCQTHKVLRIRHLENLG
jgi:flagellar motor component MotA